MSIITPKLDYARHRNTQRSKINKSTLELKDATNLHHNNLDINSHNEVSTPSLLNSTSKSPHPIREDKSGDDNLVNLFGQNFYSGNLDYITGLINTNKSTTNKSRDASNPKGRKAHQRTRSTLQGVSPQNIKIEPAVNNENIEPLSLKIQTPQIPLSLQTPMGTTQASSLKPDIEYETGVLTLDMDKSPTPRHNFSQREPNNTPVIKEERLFDQFFQKGGCGLIRRSMSLEDLRLEKRGMNMLDENKSLGLQSPTELKSFVDKSSDQSHRPNERGDFASNLNNYISYFDRSEAITQKARQKIMNKYFIKTDGGKGSQFLKKELEMAHTEMKGMKRHMDSLQNKVFELVKMNKHLIKELDGMKTKEEDYLLKLKEIEGQFIQLNQRKDHYKLKYLQTHEMLDLERGENENNVMLLKKLLSNNMHHNTLETKIGYTNARDKQREKENLKNALKEVIQQKKGLKEKKPLGQQNIYSNNRYDPQYNQKLKKREMSKYNLSTFSQLRNEDEEYLHNEHNERSEESERHVNFEDTEGDEDQEHGEDYEKMLTKDQQIKLLQEKLLELEGTQDTHQFAYEKNQKKAIKHKRESDISPQNIFSIREKERKTSHMRASNLPMRYDQHLKMKNRNEMGMESPVGEAVHIHNFRSQDESD